MRGSHEFRPFKAFSISSSIQMQYYSFAMEDLEIYFIFSPWNFNTFIIPLLFKFKQMYSLCALFIVNVIHFIVPFSDFII